MESGRAILVGAGPGDPGLITVKGLEALKEADVVLCDRLANPRLLEHVPDHCEILDVGKRPRGHCRDQEEINRLLIEKALEGKTVVRLKGGDPFVFGRGGEEADALKEAGIPCEIVPGITSAIAVPAYAGIPVTHRDYSSSIAIVTGHECPDKQESSIQWEHLAKGAETLIILMGVSNLPSICDRLIRHGRSPDTPVALIRWGTRAEQETLTGTLGDITRQVKENGFRPPAVIVVGDVVRKRMRLNWHESKPLFGKKILVPRTRKGTSRLGKKIEALGGEALVFPVARLVPAERIRKTIIDEGPFQWLSFAGVQEADMFFRGLKEWDLDIRRWAGAKVAVWDPEAAEFLREKGLQTDICNDLEAMASAVEPGERILHLRGRKPSGQMIEQLHSLGCRVIEMEAAAIQTRDDGIEKAVRSLQEGKVDGIAFASSSTVRHFVDGIGTKLHDWKDRMRSVSVVCIGPETAGAAEALGLRVDRVAQPYTVEGLVTAMESCFSKKPQGELAWAAK
jgi:uroporphyrinogen III methyltransferase / synthase